MVKKEGISPENINIMSQYNAQCSKIRDELKKHNVQNVNTVVASQGNVNLYFHISITSKYFNNSISAKVHNKPKQFQSKSFPYTI